MYIHIGKNGSRIPIVAESRPLGSSDGGSFWHVICWWRITNHLGKHIKAMDFTEELFDNELSNNDYDNYFIMHQLLVPSILYKYRVNQKQKIKKIKK